MFIDLADSATRARLQDAAKARAARLRDERVDDFWRGADAVLEAGLDHATRSAQRLVYRLARHRRERRLEPIS